MYKSYRVASRTDDSVSSVEEFCSGFMEILALEEEYKGRMVKVSSTATGRIYIVNLTEQEASMMILRGYMLT